MRAYRLTRAKYAAFSGTGSILVNGRWHWAGVPMIYCAESRALAVLETLVHARKDQIPSDYVFYEVVVDESGIEAVSSDEAPQGWRATEAAASRTFGTKWMQSRRSLALTVPSVVIPEERNLLLNSEHVAFASIQVDGPRSFHFDPRLFH